MAAMTKIRLKNQLTIPQEAMKAANLHVGDMVEAIVEEGRIILKPRILVDRDALAQELKKSINRHRLIDPWQRRVRKRSWKRLSGW